MKFDCGCEVNKDFNIENVPLDCKRTWELLQKGFCKGLFQLDSSLGKHWCKEIIPSSIKDYADITAIIRPGTLQCKLEGKSMTEHFAMRKNGKEEVKPYHPIVDNCLKDTYNLIVYQESLMALGRDTANFTPTEVNKLRKSAGKKDSKLMSEMGKLYIEKAKEANILSEEQAKEVWSWVKKSERYLFCLAHACEYAIIGYWTAWIKAHFPLQFFCSWLRYANDKIDPQKEIKELVQDAKEFNIPVKVPNFLDKKPGTYIKDEAVYFGLLNIKGIGESTLNKLSDHLPKTWEEMLYGYADRINKTALEALIQVGALPYNVSRTKMLYEYNKWKELSEREQSYISKNLANIPLTQSLECYTTISRKDGGPSNKNRLETIESLIKTLHNPPFSLEDSVYRIIADETRLLGAAITYSQLDAVNDIKANATLKEVIDGKKGFMAVSCKIEEVKTFRVKKDGPNLGKLMAKVKLSDDTSTLDGLTVFPSSFQELSNVLIMGNLANVILERDRNDGLYIKQASQL